MPPRVDLATFERLIRIFEEDTIRQRRLVERFGPDAAREARNLALMEDMLGRCHRQLARHRQMIDRLSVYRIAALPPSRSVFPFVSPSIDQPESVDDIGCVADVANSKPRRRLRKSVDDITYSEAGCV